MRDDRYSGMRLPRHLAPLFHMSWRDADRRHPERMLKQAVKVFSGLCNRELSSAVRSALRQHQFFPTLVDGLHLQSLAVIDRLGIEVASLIEDKPYMSSYDAVRMALLARAEYYAWEQRLCHEKEREAIPDLVSSSLKCALQAAAVVVSSRLFSDPHVIRTRLSFSIDENLT